jgi:hypothetical protein
LDSRRYRVWALNITDLLDSRRWAWAMNIKDLFGSGGYRTATGALSLQRPTSHRLENNTRIDAAKTKSVAQDIVEGFFAGFVWHYVQVASRIGGCKI